MKYENQASDPWGTYAPRGIDYLLLSLKHCGLGYGPLKRILRRLWEGRRQRAPVDIIYEGMKFRIYPWDNAIEVKMLFSAKKREHHELKVIQEFLQPVSTFIDIGANIGLYSILIASSGTGRVLAVEPNPTILSRLRFNISANDLNDRIKILPLAVGENPGYADLVVSESDMGGGSIHESAKSGSAVRVPVKPLIQIIVEEEIDEIQGMKIDVEGMEDLVLMPYFKNSPRPKWPKLIVIEHINARLWKRNVISWMTGAGYKLVGISRSNTILKLS